jgi:DNA polymerase III alpha subunit
MLYQEQTIQIFKDLGGFAPDEAEGVRKIIKLITSSKPDKESLKKWDKVIEKFKKGCLSNGISESVTEEILENIKESSGYSFNASHSVGYAILAAETMWYKIYYPLEFYYAVIQHADGAKKANQIYIALSKLINMGFELTFGDINNCLMEFKQTGKKELTLPVSLFKNLNKVKTQALLEQRPFIDIEDFFKKVKKFGDKRSLDAMLCMGLIDFGDEAKLEELYIKNYKKDLPKLTEEDILGFKLKTNVTSHILRELRAKHNIIRALSDISFEDKNETVNTAFEIVSSEVKKIKTGKSEGKPFLKFRVTDATGTNVTLTYFNPQRAIANGAIIAAKCKVSRFGLQLVEILGEANNS